MKTEQDDISGAKYLQFSQVDQDPVLSTNLPSNGMLSPDSYPGGQSPNGGGLSDLEKSDL